MLHSAQISFGLQAKSPTQQTRLLHIYNKCATLTEHAAGNNLKVIHKSYFNMNFTIIPVPMNAFQLFKPRAGRDWACVSRQGLTTINAPTSGLSRAT